MQPTDLAWWYGTMGESVFDRYSFAHAFAFVWVALLLAYFARGHVELFLVVALTAVAWEMFESNVLTELKLEPLQGLESNRNRYIGDTISDMAGYVTFITAAYVVMHGKMWRRGSGPAITR